MNAMIRPLPRSGQYEEEFWSYTSQHELRLQKCSCCSTWRYPASPVCPDCLGGEYDWEVVRGRGTVLGWTIFHRAYFRDVPVPYTVVCVQLDEGPLMIGNLLDSTRPFVGAQVVVTFQDAMNGDARFTLPQWALLSNRE